MPFIPLASLFGGMLIGLSALPPPLFVAVLQAAPVLQALFAPPVSGSGADVARGRGSRRPGVRAATGFSWNG